MEHFKVFQDVLDLIWFVYKNIVITIFTIWFFLFFLIGGEFTIAIKWENVARLWEAVVRYIKL